MMPTLLIASLRATALSVFMLCVVLGTIFAMLTIVFGMIFRSARLWRTALILTCAVLVAAVAAGILDRFGSH